MIRNIYPEVVLSPDEIREVEELHRQEGIYDLHDLVDFINKKISEAYKEGTKQGDFKNE